jgi:hypothetical protein
MVAQQLPKLKVAGSSPVARSKQPLTIHPIHETLKRRIGRGIQRNQAKREKRRNAAKSLHETRIACKLSNMEAAAY